MTNKIEHHIIAGAKNIEGTVLTVIKQSAAIEPDLAAIMPKAGLSDEATIAELAQTANHNSKLRNLFVMVFREIADAQIAEANEMAEYRGRLRGENVFVLNLGGGDAVGN